MPDWFKPSLKIRVRAHAVCLLGADGGELGIVSLPDEADAVAVKHALDALLADRALRGRAALVLIDDVLVRLWQVTPPDNVARRDDLEAAAMLRFHVLYGESAARWHISACWNARAPFIAAALPADLLQAIKAAAGAAQLSLTRIEPHFIASWNRHCRKLEDDEWLGVVDGEVLTLGVAAAGHLALLRATGLPSHAGPAWLAQHLKREASLLLRADAVKLALCGQVPASWREAVPGWRLLEALPPTLAANA